MVNLIVTPTQAEAQTIADYIHYQNMVKQYHDQVPPYTPAQIKQLFGAPKQFLNCTQAEAIQYYGVVAKRKGQLTLEGLTKRYATPRQMLDGRWCFKESTVDISQFTYEVVPFDASLFPVPDDI